MLALEIRFLTGRYAAGRHDDPSAAEWPPHPARVYSALTAAFHEAGPEPADDERGAMEWLARAGFPEILASPCHERSLGNIYVPVNDTQALDSVDRNLLALAQAEAAVQAADGRARTAAQRRLDREEKSLRERSSATAMSSRSAPRSAAQLLQRPRHPRFFPVALPFGDVVQLRWNADPPGAVAAALDRVCSRVSRLGHSSSLVSMRVLQTEEGAPAGATRWVPHPDGTSFIRVPHDEQLRLLEDAYQVHQACEPRVLPARPVRYAADGGANVPEAAPGSEFASSEGDWIVYEIVAPPGEARRVLLDLSLAQQVTRAMRGTLLSALDGDAPEAVSGHDDEGRPATNTHVAFLALADVGHRNASGSILGVAVVPPRKLGDAGRHRLLEGIFRAEGAADNPEAGDPPEGRLRLALGRHGVLHLRRLRGPSRMATLDPARWCRTARRWATVTPVALDRNPGQLHSRSPGEAQRATEAAEATIAKACVRIGLPEPVAVWVHRRSLVAGAPAAHRFAPFPLGGSGPRRVCVHAEVVFPVPVRGPLLFGAGRYFGVGLAVPRERGREGGP